MAEIVVPFELDADDINDLDGTPVQVASIERPGGIVLVPKRLELERRAGTAYTVTRVKRGQDDIASDLTDEDARFAESSPFWPSEDFLVTIEENRLNGRGQLIFRVPMYSLLTRATRTCVVALPVSSVFTDYRETAGSVSTALVVNIEASTGIADGTGSILGRIYFEECQVA